MPSIDVLLWESEGVIMQLYLLTFLRQQERRGFKA